MIPQVVYRPVPGLIDVYAGTDGSIVKSGYGILKQKLYSNRKYIQVYIPNVGTREAHALIATAFLGPRPIGMQVRHSDSIKLNNSANNFCYGTAKQNTQDAIDYGLHGSVTNSQKSKCPQDHEYTPENTYIKPHTGHRLCRTCQAVYAKIAETKRDKAAQMRAKRAAMKGAG